PSPSPLGVFLLIAVGGAWVVWGAVWALGAFNSGPTNTGAQAAVALGAFTPALAAVVVRRWISREGFADAGLRPRGGWQYYVLAWLLPLPVVGVIVALASTLGLIFVHTELPPMF